MPIQHFLKQIQADGPGRGNRDVRPDWVTSFINDVAELLEPIAGVGRVGFDCQLAEDGWIVGLFLGVTEIVGGKNDGQTRHLNFELNLQQLVERFDQVAEFYWSAFPSPQDSQQATAWSYVTLAGLVGENQLRLQVFSIPPDDAGPGLREYSDGRFEPA